MTEKLQGDQLPIPGQGVPLEEPTKNAEALERANIPDYSLFRSQSSDNWQDAVSGNSFPEYVYSLILKSVLLPRADFQMPIVASYLCIPSAVCNRLPVLFSHGMSGCGKSFLGKIACGIHNVAPLSGISTLASLRNCIQERRFGQGRETNCCLIWDDIKPNDLKAYNYGIFSLIKNGIERSAVLTIAAGEAGENMSFQIFSPKITSSIHPIYSLHDFREIVRRVIVVQHKPYKNWLVSDHSGLYEGLHDDEMIDVDSLDFDGLNLEFNQYWDAQRLTEFSSVAKSLNSTRNHGIEKPLWMISKDLIATGVVCGFWDTIDDAVKHFKSYWQWHKENIESQTSALQKVLQYFIAEKSETIEKQNAIVRESNQLHLLRHVELNPNELQTYWKDCMMRGMVEPGTSNREINDAMANLGWRLTSNAKNEMKWMRIDS